MATGPSGSFLLDAFLLLCILGRESKRKRILVNESEVAVISPKATNKV
jgi:hypothetical protein